MARSRRQGVGTRREAREKSRAAAAERYERETARAHMIAGFLDDFGPFPSDINMHDGCDILDDADARSARVLAVVAAYQALRRIFNRT